MWFVQGPAGVLLRQEDLVDVSQRRGGNLCVVGCCGVVGWGWQSLAPLVLVGALLALSVVDLYSYRLPDRLVFWSLGLSLTAMLCGAVATGDLSVVGYGIVGMFVYFGFLLVVHLISPQGLGFGDVKLSLLLGLNLGWAAGITRSDWTL